MFPRNPRGEIACVNGRDGVRRRVLESACGLWRSGPDVEERPAGGPYFLATTMVLTVACTPSTTSTTTM